MMKLKEIILSGRARNVLMAHNCRTVADVRRIGWSGFARMDGVGKKTIIEIATAIGGWSEEDTMKTKIDHRIGTRHACWEQVNKAKKPEVAALWAIAAGLHALADTIGSENRDGKLRHDHLIETIDNASFRIADAVEKEKENAAD